MELHLERLPRTVELLSWEGRAVLRYVDQRALPRDLRFAEAFSWEEVVEAIQVLAVRGAPAIGVAGAAALALWAFLHRGDDALDPSYAAGFHRMAAQVAGARPTAVNLMALVGRAEREFDRLVAAGAAADAIAAGLFDFAKALEAEDEAVNRAIGANGAALLQPGSRVLTHCNAGSLATVFYGTALGVIYAAAEQGKVQRIYADETRPVGQGSRLTVWELSRAGVPATLLCDNMAASAMAQGLIDCVIVGADRIARNGDTANKIGTYGVAVLAAHHGIPFYVAAPFSTIDGACADGAGIVIEQRDPSEVLPTPIDGVDVMNPAFDVTPAALIDAIITERGAFTPDHLESQL